MTQDRRPTTRELLERSHPTVDSPTYRSLTNLDPDPRYVAPDDDRVASSWEHRRSKALLRGYANDLDEGRSCLLLPRETPDAIVVALRLVLRDIAEQRAARSHTVRPDRRTTMTLVEAGQRRGGGQAA